ncbi:bifunctional UDP-sugar hydrolase/5'-nucleotidase [Mammaliicoccus sp. Dog046]|uniref:bifunctional metallophosphatase/5'-nucleotidase n=1 Tax=Mammaliicoccus sp. Dog046 TaxID=3034233 RepID=UPI002B260556|nr:bifunctional UDP-sugar hydrolase/5'-nucleotidase [Mammaliicoccus sp. Dog046]WQK84902.1 bifunctional UDP-sugar hydrolase/5'-nucleotidase [Mammaliicoccus sp. Dog046]
MKLTIFHTNDIHSHLNTYAKISKYIKEERSQLEHDSLYIDIGDHIDLFHPLTEASQGLENINILNESSVDVVTLGNNEGMTISHEALNRLYKDAEFDVTCCNLFDLEGNLPEHLTSHVVKHINGLNVCMIGLTAPFNHIYETLDWKVTSPLLALKNEIEQIKEDYDVLLVLSHVGIFFDEQLCEECPEIDVIFGAHTHHYFEQGEEKNGVLMAAAGKYGHYVGTVELEIEDHKVISKKAHLLDTKTLDEVENNYEEKGKDLLSKPIFNQEISLPRRVNSASYTTDLLCESILEFTEADCAIINAGLIVKGKTGNVLTEYDIHQMLPHPINTVSIELKGIELKQIIYKAMEQSYMDEVAIGFGFRGDIFGGYVFKNIGYIESTGQCFVKGEEIQDNSTYKLGTIDMYTFGRYFPTLKEMDINYIMPDFLRNIFEQKIMQSEKKA